MKIDAVLNDFFTFLKKPKIYNEKQIELTKKIYFFIIILFTMLICVFCTNFLIKIIIYIINFEEGKKIFNNQLTKWSNYSIWQNLSYIILLGPIIEELISRLYLDLKKQNLQLTLIFAIILTLKLNNFNFEPKSVFYLFLICLFFLIIYLFNQSEINDFGRKHYRVIFYLSCITFSFLHFSNFTNILSNQLLFLLPILVLPQLVMGIFFGYIRLKLGFFWGILLHICMNVPALLIFLLTKIL